MTLSLRNAISNATLAIALAGCGGGGSGSSPPTPAKTVDTPIATDLQASTIVARSIDALFAYDNMNSETFVLALGGLPTKTGGGAGVTSAAYAAACVTGTATSTYDDADHDTTVSAGDSAVLSASNCATNSVFPWVLNGSVPVQVVSGVNVEPHLFGVAVGSVHLRVTHAGTSIGGGRTATGTYDLVSSITSAGMPLDQTLSIGSMSIAHPNVSLQMTGVNYVVAGSSSLTTATGTFDTTVAGIGNVSTVVSIKSPLTIDSSTTRFRPTSGTALLTAADFSIEVTYGAGGAVTIRVDNGKDGVVDRTVVTTEAALDALLTTP
jgi:hypothetical protein